MSRDGGGARRFFLLGTDYVYPRTTNKILRAFPHSKGRGRQGHPGEVYTPFGHSDYQTIVADIKKFAAGGKTAVVSTVNGDSNVPSTRNWPTRARKPPRCRWWPLRRRGRTARHRHQAAGRQPAAWNYFESVSNPVNEKFVADWKAYAKAKNLPNYGTAVTNDPMEATTSASTCGRRPWKGRQHRGRQGSRGDGRASFKAPSGYTLVMDKSNHHLHKPVMIGEIQDDGQFEVV